MADGRAGVAVTGWHRFPERLKVDASESSQYASALALLAATGESFTLEITSDAIASRPYFDMTLSMLQNAGVSVTEGDRRGIFEFSTGPRLQEALDLHVAPDASSGAVWLALTVLEDPSRPRLDSEESNCEGSVGGEGTLQPDRRIRTIASRLRTHRDDADAEMTFNLADAPDLAPVLTAVATQISPAVRITGAAHLRHKESDRIHDLVEALEAVGIDVEPREDGFHVPAGRQPADRGARWEPSGDHRLVMAGLLLTHQGSPLVFDDPMVISKSYPDFWHHARFKGWATQPDENSTTLSESGSAT
jgi:3-phosphoshikimate 1-carboxyvinyltransferase